MARYRFALRPKWIVSHLFVLALVVAMMTACFWQLDRLQERKDRNTRVAARSSEPVVPVQELVDPGDFDAVGPIEFRGVTASGTYLADQEVLVRSRSRDGAPGSWILTPLALDDDLAVTVNRGWIPNSGQLQSVPDQYRAPSGSVTVTGLVRETETRGSFGPQDPAGATLQNLARADIQRLDQQVPEALLPLYVQLSAQDPSVAGDAPSPVPVPVPDEGPHLGYAVQWAIFSSIALIGYPLILRRRARELEREGPDPDLDGPDPEDLPSADDPRLEGLAESTGGDDSQP